MSRGKSNPIADKKHSKSMYGKEPFKMQAKKPEPDDRPRTPVRPASTNKNSGKAKSARVKRLTGLML